jgi:hypothetical protein
MATTDIPDAAQKIAARSTDVPWYNPTLGDSLSDSTREVLEKYSKVPASEVVDHIYQIVGFTTPQTSSISSLTFC